MKKLSWPATRFRRVTANAVVLAMAFVAAAACDDSTGPGAVTGVEVVVLPVGTPTTDLVRGSTLQLLGAPHDANNQFVDVPVTWTSSDNAKAAVSATGLVTIGTGAAAGGDVTITATGGGGTGTFALNVQHPVVTVTVTPATSTIRQEGTVALEAALVDAAGATVTRTVTWTSSNTAVATVNSSGVVAGVADGTVTITGTADNTGDVADVPGTATVTVSGAPLVATVTVTAPQSFGGISQSFQATHTSRAASGTVITGTTATWSSSNTNVATVSATGLVTLVGEGTANIRADVDNGVGVNIRGTLAIRSAPILVSGVATAVPTVTSGTAKIYAIVVPTGGAASLSAATSGGTSGDADLYILVRNVAPPTPNPDPSAFAYASSARLAAGATAGNSESVSTAGPAAGTYPISIYAWTGFGFTENVAGLSITATVTP